MNGYDEWRATTAPCKRQIAISSDDLRIWHEDRNFDHRGLPAFGGALLVATQAAYGDVAWIVSREQVLDEGWFGPAVSAPVAARLGDVALAAHAPVSFHDPADTGPFPLVCRHGSLTSAEVLVPLLAASP